MDLGIKARRAIVTGGPSGIGFETARQFLATEAKAMVFLCSERASYITGVSLNLDGGRLKGLW